MFKTNYYTGEMATSSSQEQYTTEAEAVQNASFGQYAVQQQQAYIPPTTYGLGGNVYYQNPYMIQPQQQGFGYNNNGWANPALQQGYQPYNQNNQQQQCSEIFIPPVNMGRGEYILPANFDEICEDMIYRYCQEEAEWKGKQIAERAMARRNGNYAYDFNYYNSPLYASSYNNFHSTVIDEFKELQSKAKESRYNLDIQLSKLCHNYLNDGMTDEQIEEIYSGKYVSIENTVYRYSEQDQFQQRFGNPDNLIYYDPAAPYKEHYWKVKNEVEKIMPQDTTAEEFGQRMNILMSEWELEELKDKRRNFGTMYDSNAYKRLLIEKAAEKHANAKGFSLKRGDVPLEVEKLQEEIKNKDINLGMTAEEKTRLMKEGLRGMGLTTLASCIYIDEDGNLCADANIGLNKGKTYVVKDENEAAYANQRMKFAAFMDSIPKSYELEDQKNQQYNEFSEFQYNTTHPIPSGRGG